MDETKKHRIRISGVDPEQTSVPAQKKSLWQRIKDWFRNLFD